MVIHFPLGLTRFGLWLNPNGDTAMPTTRPSPSCSSATGSTTTSDPPGAGTIHEPTNGDPQILVYNISHLRSGVPTWVIACEDLDSGGEVTPEYSDYGTDNDFQDMVIEISAISPVPVKATTWGRVKTLFH